MNNLLKYKGYTGSVEFSEDDNLLYGSVLGIRSLISYEGTTVKELIKDFQGAVDDYLIMCEEDGTEPETAYKGSLSVRLGEKLHKETADYSHASHQSINSYIVDAVREKNEKQKTLA